MEVLRTLFMLKKNIKTQEYVRLATIGSRSGFNRVGCYLEKGSGSF